MTELITYDQATGAEFARYPVAGPAEARQAVTAARAAAGPWWETGFAGRAESLRAWRREMARSRWVRAAARRAPEPAGPGSISLPAQRHSVSTASGSVRPS